MNLKPFLVEDCPPIHSVKFFKGLKKLRYAYVRLEILDHDVSPLKERNIEFKRSKNYKQYSDSTHIEPRETGSITSSWPVIGRVKFLITLTINNIL